MADDGPVDFEQMVDLLALPEGVGRQPGSGVLRGGKIGTFRLAKAVRIVIEDWQGDALRQMSAMITADVGPGWTNLEKIRALYERPDFPKSDRQ